MPGTPLPLARSLSPEAYAECFAQYKHISSEWQEMLHWVEERFLPTWAVAESAAILSVGCGCGDFDVQLVQRMLPHLREWHYVAVEPNAVHCARLRESLAQWPEVAAHVEVRPQRFEEYEPTMRFDLVHFTHCLYYISDRMGALRRALQLLRRDGRVLIFHQTAVGIHDLQTRFMQRAKGCESELFSTQELQALLEQQGLPYHLETLASRLEVTSCFDPASPRGQELLSFFLECDITQVPESTRTEITAYLRQTAQEEGGRWWLPHPVGVVQLGRVA